MPTRKTIPFRIELQAADGPDAPPLHAYAFTHRGRLLRSAPLQQGSATLELPGDLDGRTAEWCSARRRSAVRPSPRPRR